MASPAEPGGQPPGSRLKDPAPGDDPAGPGRDRAGRVPRRVALLGAESTGKTSLAKALGGRLGGIVVEEYLREFCHEAGRVPRVDEQAGIAAEQARRERLAVEVAAERGADWVICDTSPLMIALYSIDCFEDASLVAGAIDWQRGYAATLVCMPDIDWVADGIQRIGPQTRERIHRSLVDLLDRHRVRWLPVTGVGAQRLDSAMAMLDKVD